MLGLSVNSSNVSLKTKTDGEKSTVKLTMNLSIVNSHNMKNVKFVLSLGAVKTLLT